MMASAETMKQWREVHPKGKYRLTRLQAAVLAELSRSFATAASLTHLDGHPSPSHAHSALDRLTALGLATRHQNGRVYVWSITDEGRVDVNVRSA